MKYSSGLERLETPDTYFIGHYGFTIGAIEEKLKNLDDKAALNYLIEKRDRIIKITQALQSHSFSKFLDAETIFDSEDKSSFKFKLNKNNELSKQEYKIYINNLDLNKIEDKVVRMILEDKKTGKRDIDVLSLVLEFKDYSIWLDKLIRKVLIINEVLGDDDEEDNQGQNDKLVWQEKKEDFVFLFNKLFESGFFVYKKNKYQILAKHFTWNDSEIDPKKLKHLNNNINNKNETHQISDKLKKLRFDQE